VHTGEAEEGAAAFEQLLAFDDADAGEGYGDLFQQVGARGCGWVGWSLGLAAGREGWQ
jgi:hypothetical protein